MIKNLIIVGLFANLVYAAPITTDIERCGSLICDKLTHVCDPIINVCVRCDDECNPARHTSTQELNQCRAKCSVWWNNVSSRNNSISIREYFQSKSTVLKRDVKEFLRWILTQL